MFVTQDVVTNLILQDTFYAGHVIAAIAAITAIAVGLCSVITPMYVSQNAPKAIRGSLATCFNLIVLISLLLTFWINVSGNLSSSLQMSYLEVLT